MTLNELLDTVPAYAKYLKLNLSTLLQQQELNEQQSWGTAAALSESLAEALLGATVAGPVGVAGCTFVWARRMPDRHNAISNRPAYEQMLRVILGNFPFDQKCTMSHLLAFGDSPK